MRRGCRIRLRERIHGRVNIGFFLGAELTDPEGLLEGNGNHSQLTSCPAPLRQNNQRTIDGSYSVVAITQQSAGNRARDWQRRTP